MRNRSLIPEISDERLAELSARIRPAFRLIDGALHYMEPPSTLRTTAFNWDPKDAGPVEGLEKIADVRTLHTFAYYGFFKPSVAEVLAQIPEEHVDATVAFETHGPQTAEDLGRENEMTNAGYHVAVTTLYRRKS